MPNLQKQILGLFEDIDPDLREVVTRVLDSEQKYIHLERARGITEDIDQILEEVARKVLKEKRDED